MVCAGFSKKNSPGICSGDSGGPLICHQNGQTVLTGISSWTKPGCKTEMPNVFTRVSNYIEWIQRHMENTSIRDLKFKNLCQVEQEYWEIEEYKDGPEYSDSHGNGNSLGKVTTYGLKQAIEENPESCPKPDLGK